MKKKMKKTRNSGTADKKGINRYLYDYRPFTFNNTRSVPDQIKIKDFGSLANANAI